MSLALLIHRCIQGTIPGGPQGCLSDSGQMIELSMWMAFTRQDGSVRTGVSRWKGRTSNATLYPLGQR